MIEALFFILPLLVWFLARWWTWPLPELMRRGFWCAVIVLLVLPAFTPSTEGAAQQVLWPMGAGLASGEALCGWLKQKLARRALRREAAERAAQERRANRKDVAP
jgi:hypothetical protein